MSDVAGAAPAVAESAPAPAAVEAEVHLQNPISTEPQPAPELKAEPKKPEPTPREALQRAAAKVEAADKGKDEPKIGALVKDAVKTVVEKTVDAPARDETGKFLPKDGQPKPVAAESATQAAEQPKPSTPAPDAPARFSPDAKVAWSTAPEPVKAEVHRAIKEMEAGIEKHRQSAELFEPLRKYHDIAVKQGTTVDKAFEAYYNIENAWRKDPAVGFLAVCQNRGVDPVQTAKMVYERLAGIQGLPKGDSPEVAALKDELKELKSQVGNVSKTIQNRDLEAQISQWASTKPRFEELSDDIAKLLETSYAKDLDEAYDIACRLKPGAVASIPEPAPARTQDPDLTAQTLKGSKSVAGAPSTGSDPAKRPPSSSPRDALRKAFARAG